MANQPLIIDGLVVLLDLKLGEGTFSEVFKGELDRVPVAVKRMKKVDHMSELHFLSPDIRHENIASYLAYRKLGEMSFFAIDLCDGTLKDVVMGKFIGTDAGPMEDLLRQAAIGLEYLHSKSIVHGNIKPRNILVWITVEGNERVAIAKVTDFGLVNLKMRRSCTDDWMAPECRNKVDATATFAADVFSYGCVMGYALTGGRHPFGDGGKRALGIKSGRIDAGNISAIDNKELRSIVEWMINPSPTERLALDLVIRQLCVHRGTGVVSEMDVWSSVTVQVTDRLAMFADNPLGEGAYGKVYLGELDGVRVAVKSILTMEPLFEVRLLNSDIAHENIVRYLMAYQERRYGITYLALELCSATLDDVITNRYTGSYPGPMEELLRQAAIGLHFLHFKEIIHRDIKPSNILLSTRKVRGSGFMAVVKLADFGHAKQKPANKSCVSKSMSGLTGTPDWAAPECFDENAKTISFAADVFSFGCVFGYAITGGRHPFGDGPLARMANIIKHAIDESNMLAIENRHFRTVVRKMINKEPRKRPSSDNIQVYLNLVANTDA